MVPAISVFEAIPDAPNAHQGKFRFPRKYESIPADAFFCITRPTTTIADK